MIWLAFIFPIIGFILQYYPRLFNPYFGIDVWTRLLEIDAVRKNSHRIPDAISQGFLIPGKFDYPPLFPWLFSYLPKNWLNKHQGFVSPLFDALTNVLVFIIAMQAMGDLRVAVAAQAVYTFTPMMVLENSSLTPRSFGYFLFYIAIFLQLSVFQQDKLLDSPLLFIGAITATSLVFLAHRFASQSLFFFDLGAAIFYQSASFITIFVFGLVLAIVVTKGYYFRVLKGHCYNMYFWIVNRDYRYDHQVKGKISAKKNTDFVGRIYYYLNKAAPIALFGVNFWIGSAMAFIVLQATPLSQYLAFNAWIPVFVFWIIFFYLLAAIVLSNKYFLFIGEGQRYLEMSAVPAAILSGYIFIQLLNSPLRLLAIVAFVGLNLANFVLILLVQRTGVIKDRNRSLTPEMKSAFAAINKLPGKPRILCIPHYMTTMVIYFTKAEVFVNADNPGVMKMIGVFPILQRSINDVAKEYNLTHLLLKESFAKKQELKLTHAKEEFRANDIVLYKLS